MANNKIFRLGPVALTATPTTNILNPPGTTGGVGAGSPSTYIVLKHLRVVNRSASAALVSLWLGASGANVAGTEFAWSGVSVPSGQFVEWFGILRLDVADFLVGGASVAGALSIEGEGEIGIL